MKLHIADDFRSLWREHTADEFSALEQNFTSYPAHFPPVVIWNDGRKWIIVEGHARYKICIKHGKSPKTVKLKCETRQEALAYAVGAQAGRRNSTAGEIAEQIVKNPIFTGVLANENGHVSTKKPKKGGTDESLAKAAGISKKTIQRARRKAEQETEKPADDDEQEEVGEEPTVAELCEEDNKAIESFCRSLVKFFDDNVPQIHWTKDSGRIDSALSSVRAGCNTLRTGKAVVCPACEEGQSDNGKCRYCKGVGYLPSFQEKQIPAEMRA